MKSALPTQRKIPSLGNGRVSRVIGRGSKVEVEGQKSRSKVEVGGQKSRVEIQGSKMGNINFLLIHF